MIPKKSSSPRSPAARASSPALPMEETLRARGLRLTTPRRLILDVVRATDTHPSAAFVYARVRRRLPRVSLATVYRNLRRLAAEGLVRERAEPTGLRFDGNTAPHDHFTCMTCGAIFDVPRAARLPVVRDARGGVSRGVGGRHAGRVAARMGFEVLDQRVELYGRCRACRRRSAPGRAGRVLDRATVNR